MAVADELLGVAVPSFSFGVVVNGTTGLVFGELAGGGGAGRLQETPLNRIKVQTAKDCQVFLMNWPRRNEQSTVGRIELS